MRQEVKLPLLGEGVEAATVLEWACETGQHVEEGDTLLSVELEKVDSDVPAPVSGTVVEQVVQPGDEVPVGAVLCIMDT